MCIDTMLREDGECGRVEFLSHEKKERERERDMHYY